MTIPKGPTSFKELFDWHHYYADTLLSSPLLSQNFLKLVSRFERIVLHENFAGSGNAGVTLHQQFTALKSKVDKTSIGGCLPLLYCRFL